MPDRCRSGHRCHLRSYAVTANQPRIATAGWHLAKLYRFARRHQLTLAIEIGMQNAGLGVALALEHFSPQTALPGALFTPWCVLTAAGASAYLRRQKS